MRCRCVWQALPIVLIGASLLSGCYYDPYTGYSYPYPPAPPAYGYQPPAAPGPPGPALEGGPGPAAPPAYGYQAPPPAPAGGITREQFVQRAEQRATRLNRDPQRAAQRAASIFDQIDVNHTGVVTREQIRAWQAAHRRAPAPAGAPAPAEEPAPTY